MCFVAFFWELVWQWWWNADDCCLPHHPRKIRCFPQTLLPAQSVVMVAVAADLI
jgi:hypothetical protein